METKKLLGFAGSILLFIGVFMPIISAPVVGNLNYFQNGKGDGVFIILLSIVSFFFTFNSDYRKLWFTGLGSLGVLAFTFINLQRKLSEIQSSMNTELSGNPFRGLADMFIQSIQIQWGWGVLVIGAVMVIAAAAMREGMQEKETSNTSISIEPDTKRQNTKTCPYCAEIIQAEAIKCKHCGSDLKT